MLKPNSILRTKLHNPKVRSDHVHRARLINKLNNNFQNNTLTLVSAPAGYGKSYLVSCWLTQNIIPFAWISLGEDEFDLRTFLEYFTASIEDLFPGALVNTGKFLNATELPPPQVLISTMLNELDKLDKEFVLILDDYHNIKENEIHDIINTLLHYPPDNLLLCIITRIDPPLRIGSLRAYNRLNEVRVKDLEFTIKEIPVLFQNIKGFEISEEIADRLLILTEGWITGLRLMALSVNSVEQLEQMLNKIKPDTQLVSDYLLNEVLLLQTQQHQKKLLILSVLEDFCGDLIEKLDIPESNEKYEKESGEDFIKWLLDTNLFIIPVVNEDIWFRFHHLFRELLMKQLMKQKSSEYIKNLHKQAGEFFGEKNYIGDAIRHFLAAGEPEKAAELVERKAMIVKNQDLWHKLDGWLKRLPESTLNQSLNLQISMGWIAKIKYRFDELITILNRCKELMKNKQDKPVDSGEWYHLMGFYKFFFESDIPGSLNYLNKAQKVFLEQPWGLLRLENEILLAIVRVAAGKDVLAEKKINELIQEIPESSRFSERLLYSLCAINMIRGDLKSAFENAGSLKNHSVKKNNEYVEAWSRWFLGAISFHMFNLDEAIVEFTRSLELRYNSFHRAAIDSLIGLSVTYQLSGLPDKANQTILIAEDYAEWTKDPSYPVLLKSAKARIELLRGNISEAVNLRYPLDLEPIYNSMIFFLSNIHVTECRILIAENTVSSLSVAAKKLKNLSSAMETLHYTIQLVDIYVLQSVLYHKHGNSNKAQEAMKKALEIAVKGKWIRPFVEPGSCVIIILKQMIKRNVYAEYSTMIVRVIEKYQKAIDISLKSNFIQEDYYTADPLTIREKEILTLLSVGLKNREIADKIYLSPTTIKKHVYNIYQKLNAHSRIEAITIAKKLQLI